MYSFKTKLSLLINIVRKKSIIIWEAPNQEEMEVGHLNIFCSCNMVSTMKTDINMNRFCEDLEIIHIIIIRT